MLEVLPIQSKQEQEALCARCEIPFHTELLAYKALVDGELRGVCEFTMDAEGGRIMEFAPVPGGYEFEPMFVMGRAALNFIDLCGAHVCYAKETESEAKLLSSIGFKEKSESGLLVCDMKGMFDGNCGNH